MLSSWWPTPTAKQTSSRRASQSPRDGDCKTDWEVLGVESSQRDDHSGFVNVEADRAGIPEGSSYTSYSGRIGVEEGRVLQKTLEDRLQSESNTSRSRETRSAARAKQEMESLALEMNKVKEKLRASEESLAAQISLKDSAQHAAGKALRDLHDCRSALSKQKQETDSARREREESQESTNLAIASLQHELTRTQDQLKEFKFREGSYLQRIEELENLARADVQAKDDMIAVITKERDELKLQLRSRDQETKTLLSQINEARVRAESDLRLTTKSLKERDQQLDDREKRVEGLKREIYTIRGEARGIEEKSVALHQELEALKVQMTQLKEKFDRQAVDMKTFKDESAHTKKQYNQLLTLLEDRTSELKGAQTFLTTADNYSGAEVTNTLQKLNAEILQNSACMADSMVETFEFDKKAPQCQEQSAGPQRVVNMMGAVMVHFLVAKQHKDDPILVQIAFQACLVLYLRWIIMAWIVGEPSYDRFLDSVYTKVRETEAQAVSGRWRALTRAHLQQLQREEPEMLETLASSITNGLVDILATAGCSAPINKIQEKLKTAFNTKIAVMVDLAIRLNRAIGEDITSGNMEVVAVSSAMPYDPTKMDNAYEDGQPQDSASIRVLCPTDLGLQRLSKVSVTGEDEWDTKILLKPKVAIESVVDSLEDFVAPQ